MRREGTHTHYCVNRSRGCRSTYECANRNLDSNYDGFPDPVCSLNPSDDQVCEECDLSRCSDCGATLQIEPHESDCAKATAV